MRRTRGVLLRLVRRRPLAIACGIALSAPAAWLAWTGGYGVWWAEGLGLIAGATGVALLWAGLVGSRPDWIDND